MARSLTAQQLATLSCPAGYNVHTRMLVERASTWHDLTRLLGLQGLDFLEEVSISEQVDAPVATCQVRLRREVNGFSLAPLVTSSPLNLVAGTYNPLLKEARRFTVEVAVVPLGMAASGWLEVFRGRIDEVDVGGDGVSLSGRDYYGGLLQDTYIKTEHEYGSTGGTAVQTVMQSILNDNGRSAVSLYTPVSPGWVLGKYVQKGEPVMEALLKLARQRGAEVRQKWLSSGPGTGSFSFYFWSPNRSATAANWTYGPGEYRELGEVRTTLEDVRNDFEGVYSDKADLDAAGNRKRKTATDSDATSISDYDRRFMRLAEDATSNIDTSTEMATLLGFAKADLKDVSLGVQVEVLMHPGLELGDMVGLTGNGVHFTAGQVLAVQSLTHTMTAAGATTKLSLLGKPRTSVRAWLAMEQRPGIAPASPFTGPSAPSNLSTETVLGGFRVRFDPPTTGPAAAEYELHVDTAPGFTPSSSTRRVVGKLTEMVVNDLTPGTTYYAKVVPRDAKGNRGTASSEVALVPRYVETRRLQPRVSYAALPLNSDFEARNDMSAPPDGWQALSGTWGTQFTMGSDANSGSNSVQLGPTSTVNPEIASELFVVYPTTRYAIRARYKSSVATGYPSLDKYPAVYLRWYSDTSTVISSSGAIPTAVTANTWETVEAVVTAPSTARFARLVLTSQGNASMQTILFDSTSVEIATIPLGTPTLPSLLNSFTDAASNFGKAQYYLNANGEVCLMGTVKRTTAPAAGTAIFTLPTGFRPSRDRYFPVATDTGFGAVLIQTNGNVLYQSGGVTVLSLDGIRFRLDDTA